MSKMKGYSRFQNAVISAVQTIILPSLEENRDDLAEVYGNHLFGRDGPKRLDANPTRDEQFIARVFRATREVSSSVEALKDIEVYIRRFPYRNTRITKPRHLLYHIEAFLNEVYLLKKRLLALLTIVERSYKRDARAESVRQIIGPLYAVVNEALKNPASTRGSHVHEERFSDDQIDRLESLELLTNAGGMKALEGYYAWEYRKIRKDWRKRIGENNENLVSLLDFLCDELYTLLFDSEGKIIVPVPRTT